MLGGEAAGCATPTASSRAETEVAERRGGAARSSQLVRRDGATGAPAAAPASPDRRPDRGREPLDRWPTRAGTAVELARMADVKRHGGPEAAAVQPAWATCVRNGAAPRLRGGGATRSVVPARRLRGAAQGPARRPARAGSTRPRRSRRRRPSERLVADDAPAATSRSRGGCAQGDTAGVRRLQSAPRLRRATGGGTTRERRLRRPPRRRRTSRSRAATRRRRSAGSRRSRTRCARLLRGSTGSPRAAAARRAGGHARARRSSPAGSGRRCRRWR